MECSSDGKDMLQRGLVTMEHQHSGIGQQQQQQQ